MKHKTELVKAIEKEIELRKNEIKEPIESIYFGGGTPSLLTKGEIDSLLEQIHSHFDCAQIKEITLEANPDDLTSQKLFELKHTTINRLSIGIQSFFDEDLQWMNRSHKADEALRSIHKAQDIGFHTLTIDLIYGSPTTSDANWLRNLEYWNELNIPHLSAYCLTVEENTALDYLIKNKKTQPVHNEHGMNQFDLLMQFAAENQVSHYEISNFCTEDNYAVHNTNYWFNKPYLGIGPSAHSYDGKTSRKWNIANNVKYIQSILNEEIPFEEEILTIENRINEYLLTRLRTKWGLGREEFMQQFEAKYWKSIAEILNTYKQSGHIVEQQSVYKLNNKGKQIADRIASDCFI